MLPVLLVLFVVVPLVELYAVWQVGSLIGILPTLGLLVVDSIVGGLLMRSQGRAAWRNFNAAVAEGRAPAREAIDGVLVIFGGALLLTPGFVTDLFGLLLLLPPSRAVIRGLLVRRLGARLLVSTAQRAAFRPSARRAERHDRAARPRGAHDVDGTAREIDPHGLPPRA